MPATHPSPESQIAKPSRIAENQAALAQNSHMNFLLSDLAPAERPPIYLEGSTIDCIYLL